MSPTCHCRWLDRPHAEVARRNIAAAGLAEWIETDSGRFGHRSGALTVSALEPMRAIPHRVIVLMGLDAGVFLGADRTFPVPDKAHGEAVKQLLETVEDCEAKETLLTFLDERLASFEEGIKDEIEAPAEAEVAEAAEAAV